MSSPEEETFEEFLEKQNKILEAIKNPEPIVDQRIETNWLAPYQPDQTFDFLNLPQELSVSLAPDNEFNGTRGNQYPDAGEFVGPPIERQRSARSQRSQRRGIPNSPAEHHNPVAENAAFSGTSGYRSPDEMEFAAKERRPRMTKHGQESGTPIIRPAILSKRAERLADLELKVGPGGLGANGLAKGLVRSPTPGVIEWWSQDRNAWIPAIYHENLRPSLLAEARQLGKYECPRAKGNDEFDETSFLLEQEHWAGDRDNGWYQITDHVLFRFQRDNYPVPRGEVELWYYRGRIVLDMDNHPVKKYSNIPACCSSDMEGWLMEAISRLDGRITQADFRARMPTTRTTNTGEVKPLFALTALGMRMNRFRDEYSCPAWNLRTGGENIKAWFWNRMSEQDREMRMTYGLGKLTELELVELRALNKGTHPERAGNNALTSEERTKRNAEAEKKLQLKYGQQARETLAGTKRKRFEAAIPEFSAEQPTGAAKRLRMPDRFSSREQLAHYQRHSDGDLYGQPYNFRQDVSNNKRKYADAVEISDDEELAGSSKRQKSHKHLHQHLPSGYQVTNGTTTAYGSQSSSSRRETSKNLSRNLNSSSHSNLRGLPNNGQPKTNKDKHALESLASAYGPTPMESNLQYPSYELSHDHYRAETSHSHFPWNSRYEQSRPAQANPVRGQCKHTANVSASSYSKASINEQPVFDKQESEVKPNGVDDDLNDPLPSNDESCPSPKQEAPTNKRRRDDVIEESDSEDDPSFLSVSKRQKPNPSDASSNRSTYSQLSRRKQPISLKIHGRVSSALGALESGNSSTRSAHGAGLQRINSFGGQKLNNSPIVISDEVEPINERPVNIPKSQANQSAKATPRDHAIKNAELLPSGEVDFRYVEPILEEEQRKIALALGYTRLEYRYFMEEDPPQTSSKDSYATQHAAIQAALAARWLAPDPVPQLVRLGAWSTAFADFPLPDIGMSKDEQEELAQTCKEAVLSISSSSHQAKQEDFHISNDQPLPVEDRVIESLFEGDTLVAGPEDELNPEKSQDKETGPSCSNSNESLLPVSDNETDEFGSLFADDTLVADPEHEPKPEEESSNNPQAASESQEGLDAFFEDDTLIADLEAELSPEEGQGGKSDINSQDALAGQADGLVSLFPELDNLTTQFTYEELMGVELHPLTEEEMRTLHPL